MFRLKPARILSNILVIAGLFLYSACNTKSTPNTNSDDSTAEPETDDDTSSRSQTDRDGTASERASEGETATESESVLDTASATLSDTGTHTDTVTSTTSESSDDTGTSDVGDTESATTSDTGDSDSAPSDTTSESSKETGTGSIGDTQTVPDSDSQHDTALTPEEIESDWVTIPTGEFTYGSPLTHPCRGAADEAQVDVIITRPFKMPPIEITRAQYRMTGFADPSKAAPCDDCAQGWVSWYDALAWLNALSAAAGLPECYDLSNCAGDPQAGCPESDSGFYDFGCRLAEGTTDLLPQIFTCSGNTHLYPARVDCPGYRLPTAAEWEWAARGGTTTTTYNGDIAENTTGCLDDPVMNPIGWYCGNSDKVLHPVAELQPNAYGLFDMLGNVGEWTSDVYIGRGLEESEGKEPPLVDPIGYSDEDGANTRHLRGGFIANPSCRCAATTNYPEQGEGRVYTTGFRPVRTILD